jgi:hypothetical protein
MTIEEFIAIIDLKLPPASQDQLEAFETEIGIRLPEDYRQFLVNTNGGYVPGWCEFEGATHKGESWSAVVHHVGGFREELHFSLRFARSCCLSSESQFPRALLWIMDDPGGNGICIGLTGKYRGRVYLWIHDEQPDPEEWDGEVETARNVIPLANSFTDFVAGIGPMDHNG